MSRGPFRPEESGIYARLFLVSRAINFELARETEVSVINTKLTMIPSTSMACFVTAIVGKWPAIATEWRACRFDLGDERLVSRMKLTTWMCGARGYVICCHLHHFLRHNLSQYPFVFFLHIKILLPDLVSHELLFVDGIALICALPHPSLFRISTKRSATTINWDREKPHDLNHQRTTSNYMQHRQSSRVEAGDKVNPWHRLPSQVYTM